MCIFHSSVRNGKLFANLPDNLREFSFPCCCCIESVASYFDYVYSILIHSVFYLYSYIYLNMYIHTKICISIYEYNNIYETYIYTQNQAHALFQFEAFKHGFDMVTEDSMLHHLFRPEELEDLVCGSKVP